MKRSLRYIVCLLAVVPMLQGCFKDVVEYTDYRIAAYEQTESNGEFLRSTDLETYAFYVDKGTKWEVKTWDDALNHVITNKDNANLVLTTPDVYGIYDNSAEYQITLELWSQYTFIVVVDKTNKIYATRFYETPVNLAEVMVQLHLYAYKKSGTANGWDMTNPYPELEREPLVPVEDENEENNE